jgi:hypothetical protein
MALLVQERVKCFVKPTALTCWMDGLTQKWLVRHEHQLTPLACTEGVGVYQLSLYKVLPRNTTVPLTSCLTGLESAVRLLTIFAFI